MALGANIDMTDDVKAVVEDTQRQQAELDAQRKTAAQLADNYASAKKQAEQALGQQQQPRSRCPVSWPSSSPRSASAGRRPPPPPPRPP